MRVFLDSVVIPSSERAASRRLSRARAAVKERRASPPDPLSCTERGRRGGTAAG
jgi:hypothetical protein